MEKRGGGSSTFLRGMSQESLARIRAAGREGNSYTIDPLRLRLDHLNGVGYLYLTKESERTNSLKQVVQEDKSRVFDFDIKGRLLGVELLDLNNVDLRQLPADNVLPENQRLVEIFNIHSVSIKVDDEGIFS